MGVVVWRMYCPAHTGNEVGCGVGSERTVNYMNVCAVWPCEFCVLIVGWAAGFRWPGNSCP